MPYMPSKHAARLAILLLLAVELTACSSRSGGGAVPVPPGAAAGQTGEAAASPPPGGGDRKLTVVRETDAPKSSGIAIDRIHRMEGAAVDAWLSDDVVRIMTTKLEKPATATEEPKFSYGAETVDLTDDRRQPAKLPAPNGGTAALVKETPSPDGKHVFVQQWQDKYTARNFVKNTATGSMTEIDADNYLESGGWLDADTYVLATGTKEGRGDVLAIKTDGTATKLALDDAETETFVRLTASHGRIYYTDQLQNLKTLAAGDSRPTLLATGVLDFEAAPDGATIAVSAAAGRDGTGAQLLLYGGDGRTQGAAIGKGDLIPYISWSADADKLAFAVYTEDRSGMNGVYLFDAASGTVAPVVPNVFPQYPLSWNPSGTRLGVTSAGKDDLPVTEIIDFKI